MQQERAFQEERSALQAEIHRLKSASAESGASLTVEQERSGRLEPVRRWRAKALRGGYRKSITWNLLLIYPSSTARTRALANATDQTREAERLRQQFAQVEIDLGEVKALEQRNADKVPHLLSGQAPTFRHLFAAAGRIWRRGERGGRAGAAGGEFGEGPATARAGV